MFKIILTGATGNAGSAILHEALTSSSISHITVLGRREPAIPAVLTDRKSKVTNIILPSDEYPDGFDKLPADLVDRLRGHDAVIWAQGISQAKVKEDEYRRITHDYPIAAAQALSGTGSAEKPLRFIYMSGEGADQSGKSWTLFGKVKGQTEKELAAMETASFRTLSIRPGGILPSAEHRLTQGFVEGTLMPIVGGLFTYVLPSMMITSTDLARACLRLATAPEATAWKDRTSQSVLANPALRALSAVYD